MTKRVLRLPQIVTRAPTEAQKKFGPRETPAQPPARPPIPSRRLPPKPAALPQPHPTPRLAPEPTEEEETKGTFFREPKKGERWKWVGERNDDMYEKAERRPKYYQTQQEAVNYAREPGIRNFPTEIYRNQDGYYRVAVLY